MSPNQFFPLKVFVSGILWHHYKGKLVQLLYDNGQSLCLTYPDIPITVCGRHLITPVHYLPHKQHDSNSVAFELKKTKFTRDRNPMEKCVRDENCVSRREYLKSNELRTSTSLKSKIGIHFHVRSKIE